ncbi:hypothetical protein F383_15936 [Gossypium arboreum]|uniref:Uncharacterized protein n=1 Tax=Gossypium arboreum TaxID=29729 RepID=A0A0B0PN12_GOSAR|nr:hypothetical protein F383_15936 [Gossypium arboreum]
MVAAHLLIGLGFGDIGLAFGLNSGIGSVFGSWVLLLGLLYL